MHKLQKMLHREKNRGSLKQDHTNNEKVLSTLRESHEMKAMEEIKKTTTTEELEK